MKKLLERAYRGSRIGYTALCVWLRYKLPRRLMRRSEPRCIGQKQLWYMLRLVVDDSCVDLEANAKPEFDEWCWVDYWHPLSRVIFFKRDVYLQALREFAPLVTPTNG